MKHRFSFTVFTLAALAPSLLFAQGMFIPQEHRFPIHGSFSLRSVAIDASIKDQVADVQLTQVFRNLSSQQMEVSYVFPVPPDAVISQFVLLIDGKEVPAKIYTKDEARRIYESIVRTRKDPAILEYLDYGAVQTQVFPLPPHGERKISLRYSQVCRRDREVTEWVLPLMSGKLSSRPLEELRITARIDNPGHIKSVYSPSYAINVERPNDNSATVRYLANGIVPADDFRVLWSLSEKPIGASLLSFRPNDREDGYFLLLASPEVKAPEKYLLSKTVIFAIDRSGSMAGQKIEQARNALRFVLNNLRENDTFNIIAYDDRIETFKPELQRFSDETRAQAHHFIDSINDGGSTNIDGALKKSFELAGDTSRPTYVILLTDGLPTAGVTNPAQIARNAKEANRSHARLFAFGVGFDVNARLLDQLTTDNAGSSEYVRPNENIESAVAKFYARMTAPVLTHVTLDIPNALVNRLYPRDIPDLFAGSQIIAVGRYRTPGHTTIRLTGRVGDRPQTFEFPAHLSTTYHDDTYAFVEKLWATRRIGEIINELDLRGRNQELIDELVRLSTRHGILTPYTAFLADERTSLAAVRENAVRAQDYAFGGGSPGRGARAPGLGGAGGGLSSVTGEDAVNLRLQKANMQRAAIAPSQGQQRYLNAKGQYEVEQNVQVVGNKALYRRSNRWVDPSVTPDDEKKAEVVEQFSDRYFELARSNANLRRYLALPEGCTVKIDGQVYRINPVQNPNG